jgi:hypothetical protein
MSLYNISPAKNNLLLSPNGGSHETGKKRPATGKGGQSDGYRELEEK